METTLQEIRALLLGVVIALMLCFFLGMFAMSFLCEIAGILRDIQEEKATASGKEKDDYHDTMM